MCIHLCSITQLIDQYKKSYEKARHYTMQRSISVARHSPLWGEGLTTLPKPRRVQRTPEDSLQSYGDVSLPRTVTSNTLFVSPLMSLIFELCICKPMQNSILLAIIIIELELFIYVCVCAV